MFNFFKSSSNLSQAQAYEQLQNDKTIKLIDVRTTEEYRDGHIANSVNIPLDKLQNRISGVVSNKETKVFVVCLSGSRAGNAVSYMKQVGYTNVFNIGGVGSWTYGLVKK